MFILRLIETEVGFFFSKIRDEPHPPHTTIREGRVIIFLVLSRQNVGKNALILVKSRV